MRITHTALGDTVAECALTLLHCIVPLDFKYQQLITIPLTLPKFVFAQYLKKK